LLRLSWCERAVPGDRRRPSLRCLLNATSIRTRIWICSIVSSRTGRRTIWFAWFEPIGQRFLLVTRRGPWLLGDLTWLRVRRHCGCFRLLSSIVLFFSLVLRPRTVFVPPYSAALIGCSVVTEALCCDKRHLV
jgi:hypothetical protein